jgi:hypothetical protein
MKLIDDTGRGMKIYNELGKLVPVPQDHGGLGGLTDDDHTRYIDKDGTRELTGNWDIGSGMQIQADTIRSRKQGGIRLGGYDVSYTDIDFTDPAWTEVDPGSEITVAATKVSWTALPMDTDSYVYYDYGAGYFSADFRHEFTLCWTSDGAGDYFRLSTFRSGAEYRIQLSESDGGAVTTDYEDMTAVGTWYITIIRNEAIGTHGTLYAYIYTDSDRTILHSRLEVELNTSKKDFRYLFACNTYNNGAAFENTGYGENLAISTDIFGLEKGIYTHDDGTVDMEMQAMCEVGLTGTQAIAAGVEERLEFANKIRDTQNEFDYTNERYTAAQRGVRLVTLGALFTVTAASDRLYIRLKKNGVVYMEHQVRPNSSVNRSLSVACSMHLDAGDYLEGWVYNSINNDNVSSSIGTYMSICKIT